MMKMGRPMINFINKETQNLENIEISISHCRDFAIANVVAIWNS